MAERYYLRVYSLSLKVMGFPNDASDITQEVFCKIIAEKKIIYFKGQSQLWFWLYLVTINVCKVKLKKRRQLKETGYINGVFPEDLQESLLLEDISPGENLIKKESLLHLQQSIHQLPAKYRIVIKKRYVEDKSYLDTARQLKLTTKNVAVQLKRSKAMLDKIYRRSRIGG